MSYIYGFLFILFDFFKLYGAKFMIFLFILFDFFKLYSAKFMIFLGFSDTGFGILN
jgi:hypothetical protein